MGMIRSFLRFLVKLFIGAVLIAAGVLVALYPLRDLFDILLETLAKISYTEYHALARRIGGGALALGALMWIFLHRWPSKSVTFRGSHGDVTIDLDPVEATLGRVVEKLDEVRSVRIRVIPKGKTGVQVLATAVLFKEGDGDARQVTARVNSFLQAHTRKILGLQDVDVKLKITRFVINMKTVKREPLLLESPEGAGVTPAERLRPTIQAAAATVAAVQARHPAPPEPEPAFVEMDEEMPVADMDIPEATVTDDGSGSLEGEGEHTTSKW